MRGTWQNFLAAVIVHVGKVVITVLTAAVTLECNGYLPLVVGG